jgi:hypothetical protein
MHSFRALSLILLVLLIVSAPLAAQSVDTQSVTLNFNGSSGATTGTVNVTNATNVSARIGTNIDGTGAQVSSGGNTPGVFTQNVSPNSAGFSVNIGTDSVALGALARRGASSYPGATLLISATGCVDCVTVSLTINITQGGSVTLTYNGAPIPTTGISLFASIGGITSAQITVTSTNPTAFQVTSNQTWLTVNPTSGQLTGSQTIQLTANASGLPNGANTAVVTVSAGGGSQNVTVTLNVGSGGGLTLSPNPVSFQYVTSTNSYTPGQTQFVTLSGPQTSATYTATASSTPQWLQLGGSGTTISGQSVLSQLPVSVNPAVLNLSVAATYTGSVFVQTSDGLTATLNVNFSVSASPSTGTNTLTFNVASPGAAAPPAQQITISGSGSYTAFAAPNNCGQGWLSVSPTQGNLSTIATTLTVSVFPGSIGATTCTGTISISTTGLLQNGTNFQTVNVNMVIGSGTGGSTGPIASPSALTFNLPTGVTQSQSIVVNGDGTAFTAQAIGTNLTVFPTSGNTPVVLTVSANPTSSSGTIVINTNLGTQNVNVTVNPLGGNVLTANPAALAYIYQPGNPIQTQNISINASLDASGSPLSFSVASATAFVSYAVTSTTTPSAIGVGINTAQLGPGFNSGNIVLTATNAANTNLTIPITVLAPGASVGLTATPSSLTLSAQAFGGPVTQTVSLTGLAGTSFTATTISSGNWLTVSPKSGTSPATLTLTANPLTLAPNTYSGTVTVAAGNGTSVTIQVNLTTTTAGPSTPVLTVTPTTLTFNYRTGDPAPSAQGIQISSTNGSATFSATTNASWISLSQASGSTPSTLNISLNTGQLTQGQQTGTITITAPSASGSPQNITVTANVTSPPVLTLNTASTSFSYRTGDPTPTNQTVQVGSNGASLPFTISVTNAPWLTVTPTSGTSPSTITLAVDPSKVQVGNYSATVTVSSTGAASQSFTVSLSVSAPLPTVNEIRNAD